MPRKTAGYNPYRAGEIERLFFHAIDHLEQSASEDEWHERFTAFQSAEVEWAKELDAEQAPFLRNAIQVGVPPLEADAAFTAILKSARSARAIFGKVRSWFVPRHQPQILRSEGYQVEAELKEEEQRLEIRNSGPMRACNYNRALLKSVYDAHFDAVEKFLRIARLIACASTPGAEKNRGGRPNEPELPEIIKTVEAERAKKTPWKDIPAIIKQRHRGKTLSVETLKSYLKPSKGFRKKHERHHESE